MYRPTCNELTHETVYMYLVPAVSRLQHSFIIVLFILSWDKFITIFTKRIFSFLGLLQIITLYSLSLIFTKKWVICTRNIYFLFNERIYFFLFLRWVNHIYFRHLILIFFFLRKLFWLQITRKIRNKYVNNCSYILYFLLFS